MKTYTELVQRFTDGYRDEVIDYVLDKKLRPTIALYFITLYEELSPTGKMHLKSELAKRVSLRRGSGKTQ